MDGFAVRAEDTFEANEREPVRLRVLGEIDAGDGSQHEVGQGQCYEIATGAPLPRGADAVVMVEFTKTEAGQVAIFRAASLGENATSAGNDLMAGELLLRRFQKITPREVGLLAAAGLAHVTVYKRPRVAVFSSGDELVKPGETLRFAKSYDINGPTLSAGVLECGGDPTFHGILADDYNGILTRLRLALNQADIIITSGSTSSGPGDLLYRAVEEVGEPGILVHGLTIKPGKPTLIALADNKPIFGLPGYPTSALMIFHVLVAPIIRRLSNHPETKPVTVRAFSPMKFFKARGRRELLPVQLVADPNGRLSAYPMQSGSGAVSSFSLADGFADLPETQEFIGEGEEIGVELFGKDLTPPSLTAIGSHCVGLDIVFSKMAEKDRGFVGRAVNAGSIGGLHAMKRGEADVAGVHLLDENSNEYNVPFIKKFGLQDHTILMRGYDREQGLIVAPGNPKRIFGFQDLIRDGVRFINRNRGSGTRFLIDRHLTEIAKSLNTGLDALSKRIEGYNHEARSHSAVAAAVRNARADVGFGIKTAALRNRLEFLKLDDEKYDFVILKQNLEKGAVKKFMEVVASKDFALDLERLAPGLKCSIKSGEIVLH